MLLIKMADTYIGKDGYRRFTDSDTAIHKWVAEKYVIKRKLRWGEEVHHRDHNKLNNAPDNLYVTRNHDEHERLHNEDAERFGEKYRYARIPHYKLIKAKEEASGCMVTFIIMIGIISFSLITLIKLFV